MLPARGRGEELTMPMNGANLGAASVSAILVMALIVEDCGMRDASLDVNEGCLRKNRLMMVLVPSFELQPANAMQSSSEAASR
jgi:hypothetical protein